MHIPKYLYSCLHQHAPMWEVAKKLEKAFEATNSQILSGHLDYKAHVTRQVYTSERSVVEKKLDEFENEWPEYTSQSHVLNSPCCL